MEEHFNASPSWLTRFMQCHSIHEIIIHSQKLSRNENAALELKNGLRNLFWNKIFNPINCLMLMKLDYSWVCQLEHWHSLWTTTGTVAYFRKQVCIPALCCPNCICNSYIKVCCMGKEKSAHLNVWNSIQFYNYYYYNQKVTVL